MSEVLISAPGVGGAGDGGTLATRGGSVRGGATTTSRGGVVGGATRATMGAVVGVARGGSGVVVGVGRGGDGRAGRVVVGRGKVVGVGGVWTVVGRAAASTVGRTSISHSRAVADPRLPSASARARTLPRCVGARRRVSPSPAGTPSTVQ